MSIRQTRSVKGRMKYFLRPIVLHFDENKPQVFKPQLARGRVIKGSDLIAYAANAASVPESTMIMAKNAIFQSINYFVMNGHPVELAGLGSFSPRINVKVAKNLESLDGEEGLKTVQKQKIVFHPQGDILALTSAANISLEQDENLTKMACAELSFAIRLDGTTKYIVTRDGKTLNDSQNRSLRFGDAGWAFGEAGPTAVGWGSVDATVTDNADNSQTITYGAGTLRLNKGGLTPIPSQKYE